MLLFIFTFPDSTILYRAPLLLPSYKSASFDALMLNMIHEPSSLFHHSVLVDLSVSMTMH